MIIIIETGKIITMIWIGIEAVIIIPDVHTTLHSIVTITLLREITKTVASEKEIITAILGLLLVHVNIVEVIIGITSVIEEQKMPAKLNQTTHTSIPILVKPFSRIKRQRHIDLNKKKLGDVHVTIENIKKDMSS